MNGYTLSYIGFKMPDSVAALTVGVVLSISNYVSMSIKSLFIYTMIRNWCLKNTYLKSSFFILYTLRVLMDLIDDIHDALGTKWNVGNLDVLFVGADSMFSDFLLNFNVVCQLFICFNRFTAMVLPLLYSRIWDPRGNVISISLLFLINILMVYPDFLFLFAFDLIRVVLSLFSLLLVMIPIVQRAYKSNAVHLKTDRQLLYEVSIMAAVKIIENTVYAISDNSRNLPEAFFVAMYYMHSVISNFFMTLDIFFLFLISTVARNGLKTAFPFLWYCKTRKVNTISAVNAAH